MLYKRQKHDLNSVISRLCIKLEAKLWLKIPLCRLQPLPLMWPINNVDVQQLENEFVIGYRDGNRVLYVSMYNNKVESLDVSSDIFDSWSSL